MPIPGEHGKMQKKGEIMSVELQTAFQVTEPSGGLDAHMLLILAISRPLRVVWIAIVLKFEIESAARRTAMRRLK